MSRIHTRRLAYLLSLCSFVLCLLACSLPAHCSAAESRDTSASEKPALREGLEIGNRAPTFTANGLDGETIDLKEVAGESQYILLDFWASWCGPCRAEFPYLRRLHEQYHERGLRIVGICSDTDRATAARAAKEGKLTYPQVFHSDESEQNITDLYAVTGLPQTYLLDSKLRIVAKGLRGTTLERRIDKLFIRAELAGLKRQDRVVVKVKDAPLKVVNEVLAKLPKGQELSVLKRKGDWIWTSIERDGKRTKGWIHAKLIARTSNPTAADRDAGDNDMQDMLVATANQSEEATAAPPAPAEPEPADWERENPDEMPQLFEFASIRDLDSSRSAGAVGEVGRFELTGTEMSCAAVSADGRFVVSGGRDAVIRLWDAETGGEVRKFCGHEAEVLSLAFSDDGRRILSGSADTTVRLWDVATSEELYRFAGHEADVINVAFASGGRIATSTGRDKTLRMWKLPARPPMPAVALPLKVIAHRPIVQPDVRERPAEPAPEPPKPEQTKDRVQPKPFDVDLGGAVTLNSAGDIIAVDFRNAEISDARLNQLRNLKKLETLYIYGPKVTDHGLRSLKGLMGLKKLWLTQTSITDKGLQALVAMKQLESLVLSKCRGVTDDGLQHVKGLTDLKDLWLNGTSVSDRGLPQLSSLKNLETLVLPGTKAITDAGLQHLHSLPKLRDLWVNGANISNRGLRLLAKFEGLQFVDAGGTRVGDAGVRYFRQHQPDCELVH